MLALLNFSLIAEKIATYCSITMISKFKVKEGSYQLELLDTGVSQHPISYQLVRTSTYQ